MRKSIAIIGEGITEKYYIESLKGISPFQILPKALDRKASSLKDLEKFIKQSIEEGYDEVYCLIDMDGKTSGKSKTDYLSLKNKYHQKIHGKKSKGIQCEVVFLETERCTELWFLYYFSKTTKNFASYHELEKELKKYRPLYAKTEEYFRSVKEGLHQNFLKQEPKGSSENAIKFAKDSIKTREEDQREHTYSELYILFEKLQIKE